jgi:hypothetical protein
LIQDDAVGFEVLTAVSTKNVSEVLAASIIRAIPDDGGSKNL